MLAYFSRAAVTKRTKSFMTNAPGYETLFSAKSILLICYIVPDKMFHQSSIFRSKTKFSL
jgi:hypothetical protein